MNLTDIKKRYDAFYPLPNTGWDYTWVDRLRTWEDFLEKGRTVSLGLRQLQVSAANYEGDMRGLAPARMICSWMLFLLHLKTRLKLMPGKPNLALLNEVPPVHPYR